MIWGLGGFIVLILGLLALDLGVFHRRAHVVRTREALMWCAVWIAVALSFSVFIYFGYERRWLGLGARIDPIDGAFNTGGTALAKYLTGYVIEWSLSVDNVFVMAMIFRFFAVPGMYQHRVLFWGILGAIVLRGIMIVAGATLVAELHWIIYVFGAFLIVTAFRMLFMDIEKGDPERNMLVRWARRLFPVTGRYYGGRFSLRGGEPAAALPPGEGHPLVDEVVARARPGQRVLTPLAVCLIVVESTDVVFAVDSIPAIFAITADPYLVFTSNVFAVLGLRSLYFALAGMLDTFRFLKYALAVVLALVGVKMVTADFLKELLGRHFNFYLLGAVAGILAVGVAASLIARPRPGPATGADGGGHE